MIEDRNRETKEGVDVQRHYCTRSVGITLRLRCMTLLLRATFSSHHVVTFGSVPGDDRMVKRVNREFCATHTCTHFDPSTRLLHNKPRRRCATIACAYASLARQNVTMTEDSARSLVQYWCSRHPPSPAMGLSVGRRISTCRDCLSTINST